MSAQDLTRIVERASRDFDFLKQLNEDFDHAVAGYDLTASERETLLKGTLADLETIGVDARITKGLKLN